MILFTPKIVNSCFQDLRNQLYESYYLNFISAISRSKLEDIANAALGANAVTQVAKVRDCLRIIFCSLFLKKLAGIFRRHLVDLNINLDQCSFLLS